MKGSQTDSECRKIKLMTGINIDEWLKFTKFSAGIRSQKTEETSARGSQQEGTGQRTQDILTGY